MGVPNGQVDGTRGNDTIDGNFVDADGERIDGLDALDSDGNFTNADRVVDLFGNNSVALGEGNDTAILGDGNQTVIGGDGNDRIIVGAGNSSIIGGAGNDRIQVGPGSQTIFGGDGSDVVRGLGPGGFYDGGEGTDRLDLNDSGFESVTTVFDSLAPLGTGTVSYYNEDGTLAGTSRFRSIETFTRPSRVTDPTAVDESVTTTEDVPVSINVLANDLDNRADFGLVTPGDFLLARAPLSIQEQVFDLRAVMRVRDVLAFNGDASINADGTVFYSPNPDFFGQDTIRYTVGNQGGGSDSANVFVTITASPDAPRVPITSTTSASTGDPFGLSLLSGVVDPDNPLSNSQVSVTAVGEPGQGTIVGGVGSSGIATFTPPPGIPSGTTNFTVTYTSPGGVTVTQYTVSWGGNTQNGVVDGTTGADSIVPGFVDTQGDGYPPNGPVRIDGQGGNDTIRVGDSGSRAEGNTGNDSIILGDGVDSIDGGAGRDTIDNIGISDFVDGGFETGLTGDVDVLRVPGLGSTARIRQSTVDPENGRIVFFNGDGESIGEALYFDIERIVCFTPGTFITTPDGLVKAGDLHQGSQVLTRDNGVQEIRWVGKKHLSGHDIIQQPKLRPILIRAGSLGNGVPEQDMMVSPNHRMLIANSSAALYFDASEVLVPAKNLVGINGVSRAETASADYIHFMFDEHQLVLGNNCWSESFQPGEYGLGALEQEQRDELFALFPDLKTTKGLEAYHSARKSLNDEESLLLRKMARHQKLV